MTGGRSLLLHWLRHGENPANVMRQLSYRLVDHGLTSHGQLQAAAAAADFARSAKGCKIIFSSPLRRAQETAAIVAERLGARVRVIEEFRELDVGELDGRSDEEAWRQHDAIVAAWQAGCPGAAFPGGEDQHALVARIRIGLARVLDDHGPFHRPALTVAHSGVLRMSLSRLLTVPVTPAAPLGTGEVADLLIYDPSGWRDGRDITAQLVRWSRRPVPGAPAARHADGMVSEPIAANPLTVHATDTIH